MSVFIYKAIDVNGKEQQSQIEANSKQDAKNILTSKQYIVYEIKELRQNKKNNYLRLGNSQKTLLIRQLATLMSAGFTLEKSLKSVMRQTQVKNVKQLISHIYQKVTEGVAFHQSLAEFPKLFPQTFVATVAAGESSSYLPQILERLADYSENADEMKNSIKQAMIYPIILTVVSLLMITYLLTSVIPSVVDVFVHSNQELPTLTKILLSISYFVQHYGIYALIILILVGFVVKKILHRPAISKLKHGFLLRMPIIGNLIQTYQTANYCATLSILLNSGVRLVEALKISSATLANLEMKKVAEHAFVEVQTGKSLSQSLITEKHIFPSMLIELIASGEQSATLTMMLEKASNIYHKDSQSKLNTLINLLAPLMILIMGGIIFLIVLGILLPILDLNQTIK